MKLFQDLSRLSEEEKSRLAHENYLEWKNCPDLSADERAELEELASEEKKKQKVFLSLLEFGTAGIRGKMQMGAGSINRYTVAVATKALAYAVKQSGGAQQGVVIACDSRNHSEEFARITASVLAKEGVKVWIFDSLRPTPELSYAILALGCRAGVNVTASHNTKEYNGYKAYWDHGAQISVEQAKLIASQCYEYDLLSSLEGCDFDSFVRQGKITVIGKEMDERFLSEVLKISLMDEDTAAVAKELKIVYSPLHGTGYALVPEVLRRDGFSCVTTVEEQMVLDGDFPTVAKPNPQDKAAFDLGIALADRVGSEAVVATDPDADRAGIAIRQKDGSFRVLTGNQIGCLLLEYIINARRKTGTMPENPAAVMSLVSTNLAEAICKANGVTLFKVYTGFKYIGEKISQFEQDGSYTYLFGFEESHGYLGGTYARDKDAVGAAMLICEMAAFYKAKNMTLSDALAALYEKYGFVCDYTYELAITDVDFLGKMAEMMAGFRKTPLQSVDGEQVVRMDDYLGQKTVSLLTGEAAAIPLAKENMLGFLTARETRVIIRPSGTEPKIKVYVSLRAENAQKAEEKYRRVLADVLQGR